MAFGFPEPSPRYYHFSAAVEGQLYVYGGHTKDYKKEKSSLASKVHLFNPSLESWQERRPEGLPPPPGIYSGACASVGHHAYFYGGYDGTERHGSLYQLNTSTFIWSKNSTAGPMKKSGCKMISSDDNLILFGGFGLPSGPIQPGAEFVKSTKFTDGRGWTNELHTFSLRRGKGSL